MATADDIAHTTGATGAHELVPAEGAPVLPVERVYLVEPGGGGGTCEEARVSSNI